MKVLVIGASSPTSIGKVIEQLLLQHGVEVILASRSGRFGTTCDIRDNNSLRCVLQRHQPHAVVHAAGVYTKTGRLGCTGDWNSVRKHLAAKALGSLALIDAAVQTPKLSTLIFLGGRTKSADPTFAVDCMANAAMKVAVEHANQHAPKRLYCHYVNLPLVSDSAMGARYLAENPDCGTLGAITSMEVAEVVRGIIFGKIDSAEIKLGEGWEI